MTETPDLPLRSGVLTLQQLANPMRKQAHQIVIRSVAHSMKTLAAQAEQELLPENAVAATFANTDDTGFVSFDSSIIWVDEQTAGTFVQDLTSAIELERRTGLYTWGQNLQRTQAKLGGNSQLIALTAMMGVRSRRMLMNSVHGIVYISYMGDGQIVATLLNARSEIERAQYMQPSDEHPEVSFAGGRSADIRGDLAFLYSLLTVSEEEIHLLV